MTTDILVPTLGESVTEATVAQWLKRPGETVAVDDPLVELETDKVTLEVNATAAGVLAEVLAEAGAEVEVGAVLGRIGEGDGAPAAGPEPVEAVDEAGQVPGLSGVNRPTPVSMPTTTPPSQVRPAGT